MVGSERGNNLIYVGQKKADVNKALIYVHGERQYIEPNCERYPC
jgi:hypothetical protein